MRVLQLNIRKALIDTMLSGIKQGGYDVGASGSWPIRFPSKILGISGDYSGSPDAMEWGPGISGSVTGWSSHKQNSTLRIIAIGY